MTEQTKPQVTAKTDQEKRKKVMEANRQAMQLLLDQYPEIFSLENARPLKIGIHEELAQANAISKTKIRKALATYVRQIAYYKCLVKGAARVNLNGETAGEVSEEDALHAKNKLNEIFSKRKERQIQAKKTQVKQARLNDKLSELVNKTNERR